MTQDEIAQREGLKNELEHLNFLGYGRRQQNMKLKWAEVGNANSRLFFEIVKGRRKKNFIGILESRDGWSLRDDEEIRREISRFYKDLFSIDHNETICKGRYHGTHSITLVITNILFLIDPSNRKLRVINKCK